MKLSRQPRMEREEELSEHLTKISALVYALLHDVAAWLSRTEGAVDLAQFPEYRLQSTAGLSSAEKRLSSYLNDRVLADWKPVIEEWLSQGYGYRPAFGRNLRLAITKGESGSFWVKTNFKNRSEVELPGGERRSLAGSWGLEVRITQDLGEIIEVNWISQS